MEVFVIVGTNVEFHAEYNIGVIDSIDKLDKMIHEYYGSLLSEDVTLTKISDNWEDPVMYIFSDEFNEVEISVDRFILNKLLSD